MTIIGKAGTQVLVDELTRFPVVKGLFQRAMEQAAGVKPISDDFRDALMRETIPDAGRAALAREVLEAPTHFIVTKEGR